VLVPAFDNPARPSSAARTSARERGYVLLAAEDFDGQQADAAFTELVESGGSTGC
jgi:hypothetical protein